MTPEQEAAAKSKAHHIVVAAGPGAGKTRTLVARLHHLIDHRVNPGDIVVITYTNAAAAEITRRLKEKWPHHAVGYCGTLHGFMLRLLRKWGNVIGLPPELAVVSDEQKRDALAEVVAELKWKGSEKAALEAVKTNPLLNRSASFLPKDGLLAASYHRRMLENGLLDYDSILQYGRVVLDFAPFVAKHLLVDEFQDASDADDAIYEHIRAENKFFVGDPDQSIYGFRGGNPQNFVQRASKSAAGGGSLFYLEKNYRCGVQICAAANLLILHNKGRLPKQTVPVEVHDSSTVEVIRFANEGAELARLTQEIAAAGSLDIAVLCRTNHWVNRIADHLEGCGIPVARRAERTQPTDWPVIRQYIALLCNPDNDFLAYQWLKAVSGEETAKEAKRRALAGLTTINKAVGHWQAPTLAELPDLLAMQSGGWRDGIRRVKDAIAELPGDATMADLSLALAQQDHSSDELGKGIVVTTLHSAKGREWETVFLPGFVEGLCPSKRGELEEERRLAFVGFTRAKRRLVVMVPGEVLDPYSGEPQATEPSRFIAEAGL